MALAEVKFYSEAIGMNTGAYVIMPQQKLSGQYGMNKASSVNKSKCLYLLHGLSDDYSIWLRRTSIERYAADYGIYVVMPGVGRSFYTDMKYGGNYYTYIAKELPQFIQNTFNVSSSREDNYIAGLSMGGYGALKIALKECGSYAAAAGLSSVADIRALVPDFKADLINVFGEDVDIPDSEDLFALAKNAESNPEKPRIFMSVGTEDFMYKENVNLKRAFEALDYDYTYFEEAGTHNWNLWDKHIQLVLEWMFKNN